MKTYNDIIESATRLADEVSIKKRTIDETEVSVSGMRDEVALMYDALSGLPSAEEVAGAVEAADRAEAAAVRAESQATRTVKDAAEFFSLRHLEVGRYSSQDGLAWDVSPTGVYIHTSSNAKYSPVAISGAVDPRCVGSPCNGVDDDTPHIQSLLDFGFDVRVSSPNIRLNNLRFVNGRKLLSNVGSCILSSGSPFTHGNVGWREQDMLSYTAVASTAAGQATVVFTTPQNATSFAVGDVVFVRGSTYHNATSLGNTYKLYDWGVPNSITSVNVSGNTITELTLRNPLDETVTSPMIANVTKSSVKHITTGNTLFISSDVSIEGFDVKCTGTLFSEGGGLMNSKMSFGNVICDSFAFTNMWDFVELSANHVDFARHWFELALGSTRCRVHSNTARLTTNPVTGKRPIRLSEGSRNNYVECGVMDLSLHSNGDPPIYLAEGRGNHFKFGKVFAQNAYPRIFNMGSQALTPSVPRSEDNTLEIGLCLAGGGSSYGQWVTSGGQNKRNKLVRSVFRGNVSSGRAIDMAGDDPEIIDVRCEGGGLFVQTTATNPKVSGSFFAEDFEQAALNVILSRPGIKGIMSPSRSSISAQDRNISAVTVASETTANVISSQDFPAGSLRVGDVVEYDFSGICTGNDDTANVELWIGGAKIVDVTYAAQESGFFFVRGNARVQASTALRYQFERVKDVSNAIVGNRVVSDLSTNNLVVELRAYRTANGNPAGTLVINSFRAKAFRAGG